MNSFRTYKLKLGCHGNKEKQTKRRLFHDDDSVEDNSPGGGAKDTNNLLGETPVKTKSNKAAICHPPILINNEVSQQSISVKTETFPRGELTDIYRKTIHTTDEKENRFPGESRGKSPAGEVFSCKFCQRTFTYFCHLKVHERIHTGEKPYSCTKCSQNFSQLGSLTVHMRIHTGEKPYDCAKCAKRFRHINSLRRHQRQVHLMKKEDFDSIAPTKRKSSDSDDDKQANDASDVTAEPQVSTMDRWSSLRHTCSGQIIKPPPETNDAFNHHLAMINYYSTLFGTNPIHYDAIYRQQYIPPVPVLPNVQNKKKDSSTDESLVSNDNASNDRSQIPC